MIDFVDCSPFPSEKTTHSRDREVGYTCMLRVKAVSIEGGENQEGIACRYTKGTAASAGASRDGHITCDDEGDEKRSQ